MGITQNTGASSLIRPGVIDNTAARPASPYEGQVIFQKDTDQLLVWNGTAWVIPNSPAQNPTGLEYISTTTFSGSDTANFSSIFTSNYTNYRVVIRAKNSTTAAALYVRFLTGTTTVETSNIYTVEQRISYSGSAAIIGTRGDSYSPTGGVVATYFSNYAIEFYSPNVASQTNFTMLGTFQRSLTDSDTFLVTAGNRVSTQLTGFQLTTAGGGSIDGSVILYGYRNS
jgi:hypothetical protein